MNADKSRIVRYLVQGDYLQNFVRSLLEDVRETLSDNGKTLGEKHNCYVEWVLTLLYFSTAHRPVGDPFCYARQISLEDGWCLIDDKVVEEGRRFRMAPLSATSVKQLRYYYAHLQMLGARLSRDKDNVQLGQSILSVLDCPDRPELPLFFYLNKKGQLVKAKGIGASDVYKKWKKYIDLPRNEGRRSLASALKDNGVESELIRVLLGHEDGLDPHFNYLSRWSPRDAMRTLSAEVGDVQEFWGFKAISSFLQNKISARKYRPSGIVHVYEFGPEKRENARKKLAIEEDTLVRNLIDDIKLKSRGQKLTETNVNRIIEKVVLMAEKKKLNPSRCLRLVYQYLRKEQGLLNKEAGKTVKKRIPIVKPLGKVHEGLVVEYRDLKRAREAFFQIIADSHFSGLSGSEKIAFISISAVLMDYLVSKKVFHQMVAELPESIYKIGGAVVGDFFLSDVKRSHFNSPFYRWMPSGFSRALLLQMYSGQADASTLDDQEFIQKQRAILKLLFPHIKVAGDREEYLFRIVQSGLFINKHPLIRAYYEPKSGYTSLPIVTLERLVKERKLATSFFINQEKKAFTLPSSIRIDSEGKGLKESNNRLYEEFVRIFTEARNTPISGNNRHKKQIKKVIRKEVLDLLGSAKWTVAGEALLRWLVELCEKGTHHKENLAFSTINKYVFIIAKPLLEQARDTNILVMGEVCFERLYVRMASYSKADSAYAIDRMREFHRFCEDRYSVPNLDWGVIYSEAHIDQKGFNKALKADANILSAEEYSAALSMLVGNANRAPLYDCQLGFCLIMGYRFGLRIDEVFSLLERQVCFNDTLTAIQVAPKTNIYGDGKSESFSRNIPLLFELEELEKGIFQRVLDAAVKQLRETGDLVFLMAHEGESRGLLGKQEVSKQLGECLKIVTGDETLRFHHLRHTWATSIGVSVVEMIEGKASYFLGRCQQGKIANKDQMRRLLGVGRPSIEGICKIMGHANIDTFIASYLHCLEYSQPAFESLNDRKLANRALTQVLGVADAVLRKRYSRLKYEGNDSIFPLTSREFKCFPEAKVETSSRQFEGEEIKPEMGKKISLTVLNRILLDYRDIRGNSADYSARYGLSEGKVLSVLEQAVDLEIRSAYESYRLNDIVNEENPMLDVNTNRSENKRFNEYVSSLEIIDDGEGLQPDQMLRSFVGIWVWGYCPGKGYFIVRSAKDLNIVREGMARLGMGVSVELIVGSDSQKKNLEMLGLANAKIKTIASFSPGKIKFKPAVNAVFGVRLLGLPAKLKTMGTFHRFMFLLSLYVGLHPIGMQ